MIKIGGASLFHSKGFESDLRDLLAEYAQAQIWMLVGGGDLVEAIRTANTIYPKLNAEEVHWRCVGLLDHTWELAKEIFPTCDSIATREELQRFSIQRNQIGLYWVRVQSFYSRSELATIPKSWRPESNWNTTTDVLAWLLAKRIDAERIVLMKQCECDPSWSLEEAARLGVVDSELARLAVLNGGKPQVRLVASK